jgi:thioredoxin-like negative regulator of GroEL
MKEISNETLLNKKNSQPMLLFIHTPFCGTCQLARKMLETIEHTMNKDVFYDMNGSLFPEFLQTYEVESVPCFMVMSNGQVENKVYAFRSVQHMYEVVEPYKNVEI